MRVVRQAQRISTQLPHNLHILAVHLRCERIANAETVLMASHAAQGLGSPVEEKTRLGIKADGAAAKARFNLIAAVQSRANRIQVGIPYAVPQMHIV